MDTSTEGSNRIWVEAEDRGAGIGRVEVGLEGPEGPWRDLDFESEYPQIGATTVVDVPSTTAAGNYRVSSLSVTDRAGNRTSLDQTELEEAGLDAGFDVYEGPDVEGPKLTDYSLAPETLDTSAGAGSVTFTLSATDDLSGVRDAAALIRLPGSGPPLCFPCGHRAPSALSTGTIFDGAWVETLPLPRFARSGTYDVAAVVLYDRAGNRSDYDREELEGLGYPVEFTQTGAGDSEPPQIVDFWISPETVRSSHGEGAIRFFVHVTDDLSGVGETADSVFERLLVQFHPPHAMDWWYSDYGTTMVSGTELDGIWRSEIVLPPEAETGTWTIPAIDATDRAGNTDLLRGDDLLATGWDLTFENLP